jgi:predicted nucleotidyltransferase component of viral defense system
MLGFSSARLLAYSKETVVAEKLEAMVVLGIANSRMKDSYDIWMLSREYLFDGRMLAQAIGATFEHHAIEVPRTPPTAFTEAFAQDPIKLGHRICG